MIQTRPLARKIIAAPVFKIVLDLRHTFDYLELPDDSDKLFNLLIRTANTAISEVGLSKMPPPLKPFVSLWKTSNPLTSEQLKDVWTNLPNLTDMVFSNRAALETEWDKVLPIIADRDIGITIDFGYADLGCFNVPASLKGIKMLILCDARNIPAGLISRALEAGVKSIFLGECDLTGVTVPDSLTGVEMLHLTLHTKNPAGLISRALEAGVKSISLEVCDLTGVTVPDSLTGVERLDLSYSINIPAGLISRALEAGVKSISLSECDLTGVCVPASLKGVEILDLYNARNIPAKLILQARADGVKSIIS